MLDWVTPAVGCHTRTHTPSVRPLSPHSHGQDATRRNSPTHAHPKATLVRASAAERESAAGIVGTLIRCHLNHPPSTHP